MNGSDPISLVLKAKLHGIVAITPDKPVYDALALMEEHHIGALMVIESGGRLVGMFSERDYARKGVLKGHLAKSTRITEIMTSPVVFVSPERTVDDCMAMMTEHHFRHLPVLQDDKVLGVVSIGDLVKWVITGQAHTIQELQGYLTGTYPG